MSSFRGIEQMRSTLREALGRTHSNRSTTLNGNYLNDIRLHKPANNFHMPPIGSIDLTTSNASPTDLLEASPEYEEESLLDAAGHKPRFKILKAELDSVLPADVISQGNDNNTPDTDGIPTNIVAHIGNRSSSFTVSPGNSIHFTHNSLCIFMPFMS